ncbi:MAG TPA: alanine dehydrogenase, partial [Nitrosomonas sp.]|nr:alanine dehydrogenase [Nitrosomonas sp.]
MLIGVPKEIKIHENRVGLTPASVRELVVHGHQVIMEKNAGLAIDLNDDRYQTAGAEIVDTAEEIYSRAELIVKVKELQPAEFQYLRAGQILFTYLHLAPDPAQAERLLDSGCIAIAYETVTDKYGG